MTDSMVVMLCMERGHHKFILGCAIKSVPFRVATITPVIRYGTDGLEIKLDSVVVSRSGKAIPEQRNKALAA